MEITIILLLIICNGVFALAEAAVLTSRKALLRHRADQGDKKAQKALELAESPNRFLSSVQIGITLIGILSGAFGGAMVAEQLEAYLLKIPSLAAYAQHLGLGLVVVLITYLSLVIGELVPKRIAMHNPERIAAFIAKPMHWVSVITAPIVAVLSFSTEMILRLLGLHEHKVQPVTEQEITGMIEQGTLTGAFDPSEHSMVKRIFRLGDRTVESIMTHRSDIIWINLDEPLEDNMQKIFQDTHSSIPVCRGDLDNVVGILRAKDLLRQKLACNPQNIDELLLEPVFITETLPALKLLEKLKQERIHSVLVVDEYGTVKGLVTVSDILEAIVGELPVLNEPEEPYAIEREDGSWLLDGLLPMDEFKELMSLKSVSGEDTGRYLTLGGYILMKMERIPSSGDNFTTDGLRFEIIDMDGNRIDKILVSPAPLEGAPQETNTSEK